MRARLTILAATLVLSLLAAPQALAVPAFSDFATGLNQPRGVAVDVNGNVYVAESGASRIRKYDKNGVLVATLGTTGTGNGQMQQPTGVAVDANGNVFFADRGNKHVQRLAPDGAFVRDFGVFADPAGVEVDAAGHVLVVDVADDILVKFAPNGTLLNVYGKPGGGSGSGPGEFNAPLDVDADPSGDTIVADSVNNRVQRLDPFGVPVSGWTSPAGITSPAGVSHDLHAHTWVTDQTANVFRELDPNGNVLQTLGGPGAGPGQFSGPYGIDVDCTEAVFVADPGNSRVQRWGEAVDPIAPPCVVPTNTRSPLVAGQVTVGSGLALDPGDWIGAPTPTFAYRWQRCPTLDGESCGDIPGARGLTYVVTEADRGNRLRAVVVGTNVAGTVAESTDMTAAVPTVPVTPLPPAPPNPAPTPGPPNTSPPVVKRIGFAGFRVSCPVTGRITCEVRAELVGPGRVKLAAASGEVRFKQDREFKLRLVPGARALIAGGYRRTAAFRVRVDGIERFNERVKINRGVLKHFGKGKKR